MNHFNGLNTLNLEMRVLTPEELTTISGNELFTRIKNIVFSARKKAGRPENGTLLTASLLMIADEGLTAMNSQNLIAMKDYYRDIYLPLVTQPTTFNKSGGIEDYGGSVDSEWADYFGKKTENIDTRINEIKYGATVFSSGTPMAGFETDEVAEASKATMRTIQWVAFAGVLGYFAYSYFHKTKRR